MKKKFDHSFLNDFINNKEVIFDPESKSAMRHDHWDKEALDSILEEVAEFTAAQKELSDFVPTGGPAMADLWYSIVKAIPELKEAGEVRPSYLINRAVEGEMMSLKEWDDLHSLCVGDVVGAAISATSMEPTMEIVFDRLKDEQKLAQSIEDMLGQMAGLEQEELDLDEMMAQAMAAEGGATEQQKDDYQDQKERIKEALEKLKNGVEDAGGDLQDALDGSALSVRMALREMLEKAVEDTEYTDKISQMWGLEPGQLLRMSPQERLELAQKLNTPRFKQIVDVFGPAKNQAMHDQMRKTIHSHEEVYELSRGNDLSRVLPVEFLTSQHPILKYDFYRKYHAGELLQYELKGEESVAKGGIIWCEDGSGSMMGQPEIWAKAIGLCILHIARLQKRSFYGIHFGSVNELRRFDFTDTANIDLQDVMDFASHFFNGGTDFMTPLNAALAILEEEYAAKGFIEGDIVFCTDGQCGVDDEWLAKFKERQATLGFRVFGVAIECPRDMEPLWSICDGRVMTVSDLLGGKDIREMFGTL